MPEQAPGKDSPGKDPAAKALTRDELAKIPDREKVTAEMVANVWKITAKVGDVVEEGDTLVILESMKMEIPVVAEVGGTVKMIAVTEGDVIQEGDLIAVVG
jgi:biotin carboxyl carrier protein